jgi:hypothetical protein
LIPTARKQQESPIESIKVLVLKKMGLWTGHFLAEVAVFSRIRPTRSLPRLHGDYAVSRN